jgi:hypothetical protein
MKIVEITLLGSAGNLVELTNGLWLQARLARVILRINDLDVHLDGESTSLHPPFSRLASLAHGRACFA